MFTPLRSYEEELLDAGVGTDEDVAGNLLDLRRLNRFLGGTRTVLKALEASRPNGNHRSASRRAANHGRLSFLDVGTGSADIPTAVIDWCRARGIEPSCTALDVSERNLRVARANFRISPEVALLRADALELPFAANSFDYVTASQFLHHFRDEDVVRLMKGFAGVARRAVIIHDLVRNLVPYYLFRATGVIFLKSFLTRSDAPLSVLRGFTAEELSSLAHKSGLDRFEVRRYFPYRLSLIADVSDS
ncbi:MAG: methyltransferase domain-containing protein [Blastocatellia bacterium]|nr:methyltransferase domain-containing protein [Blastocatellia bacterium]